MVSNIEKWKKNKLYTITDRLLWHSMASLLFPAITIHAIHKGLTKLISKTNSKMPYIKYISGKYPLATLGSLFPIPLIIHPIDHVSDFIMDNTYRVYYKYNKLNYDWIKKYEYDRELEINVNNYKWYYPWTWLIILNQVIKQKSNNNININKEECV